MQMLGEIPAPQRPAVTTAKHAQSVALAGSGMVMGQALAEPVASDRTNTMVGTKAIITRFIGHIPFVSVRIDNQPTSKNVL
jgi:hypothetical protein